MYKAMKIRLLPTKDQEEKMLKTINVCRFAWNWGLNFKNNFYNETGKSIKGRQIRSEFTKFKKTEGFEWINEVSSKAYENEFDKLNSQQKTAIFSSIRAGLRNADAWARSWDDILSN